MKGNGTVVTICISPVAGQPMRKVKRVMAVSGAGLEGDRYCTGQGSFNKKGGVGKRQVTLMNVAFFERSGFKYVHSRRNIFVKNVELMYLIGKEFQIGAARFRGIKYCEPCDRPSGLIKHLKSFEETFLDGGGLVAEILEGGEIKVGDPVISPPKNYS